MSIPEDDLPFTGMLKRHIKEAEAELEKAKREAPHVVDIHEAYVENLKIILERGKNKG